MKVSAVITLSSFGLVYAAPTSTNNDNTLSGSGFVSIDIQATTVDAQDNSFTFYKRDRTFFDNELVNKLIYYSASIGVGTPAQYFPVTIDTGSSDFWIAASKDIATPYFNGSLSSSYVSNNTQFAIHYVKGSNTGTWATETVTLGPISVTQLPFGNVNKGVDLGGTVGVMGIGAMQNEAPVILNTGTMYPNFPRKLKEQGHIKKVAYSLYLNSLNSTSGSLLFGGVDKSRFNGHLYTVPVVSDRSLDVTLTSLGVNGDAVNSWEPAGITLDSGTSFTYLPPDAVSEIGDKVDGADLLGGLYFIDSTNINWKQNITFDFSGAKIHVPIKSFSLRTKDVIKPGSTLPAKYDYLLGVLPNINSRGISLLGDSFLRSAYVVYDLESWEVSLAEASYGSNYANIQPIVTTIPFAVAAPDIENAKKAAL